MSPEYSKQGSVCVGAIEWSWRINEVISLPEGGDLVQSLSFSDPQEPGNSMTVDLSKPLSILTDDDVKKLGCSPNQREVISPEGRWIFHPLSKQPGVVRAELAEQKPMEQQVIQKRFTKKSPCHIRLPDNVQLGEIGNVELLQLLQ